MSNNDFFKIVVLDRVDDHINRARNQAAGLILDLKEQIKSLERERRINPCDLFEIKIGELNQIIEMLELIQRREK